ncbi:hypothetical protein DV515_00017923 [Chloebia gouldiae]|uniref:Uncharacterized protein n=1 Tax=Chloebia gouldiae TaxID=44316 RepID=A0A3L8Q953_CHLGU|nr:hypothetical protein DV515_00017923 [Chloebia gouldiae]
MGTASLKVSCPKILPSSRDVALPPCPPLRIPNKFKIKHNKTLPPPRCVPDPSPLPQEKFCEFNTGIRSPPRQMVW